MNQAAEGEQPSSQGCNTIQAGRDVTQVIEDYVDRVIALVAAKV